MMSPLAAPIATSCSAAGNGPAEITVDPAITYQAMKGWEATARLWEYNKEKDRYDSSWLALSDQIFDRLVNELGINRVRLADQERRREPRRLLGEVRERGDRLQGIQAALITRRSTTIRTRTTSIQRASSSRPWIIKVEKTRPAAQAAGSRPKGEKLFVNFNYVDFGQTELKGNLSHARQPAEYAELIHAAFVHLREQVRPCARCARDHPRARQFGRLAGTSDRRGHPQPYPLG